MAPQYFSKKELGYFCEKTISQSHIFMTQEDFAEALNALQSLQSLDLGAPKVRENNSNFTASYCLIMSVVSSAVFRYPMFIGQILEDCSR